MSDSTGIEWTDATWNPVRGCTKVSAGCAHCYAETVAARFSGPGQPYAGLVDEKGHWNGEVRLVPEHLSDPIRWQKPRRIFVNSMSDLFHERISSEFIAQVWSVMAVTPRHTFQILTKRPERMRDELRAGNVFGNRILPNVWLGVSVEDQKAANARIPMLLETPAAVRFLSCEPLLGPVNLDPLLCQNCGGAEISIGEDGTPWCPMCDDEEMGHPGWLDPDGIGWVIAGGESGHGARPMHAAWVRSLRDQCTRNEVPFFFKQWGEWIPHSAPPASEPPPNSIGPDRVRWLSEDGEVQQVGQGKLTDGAILVDRIGKARAGRLLDGRTWDEFPEVAQ